MNKKGMILCIVMSLIIAWACTGCAVQPTAESLETVELTAEPSVEAQPVALEDAVASPSQSDTGKELLMAVQYLAQRMDETVGDLYVYKGYGANENRFVAKGLISSLGHESLVCAMDENCTEDSAPDSSFIDCRVGLAPGSWGGWLFINGTLPEGDTVPVPVWGDVEGCALDLSGAAQLTFMARGETGSEAVEFFVGGLGRSGETGEPVSEYPDSTAKVSTGVIQLSSEWKQYTIGLTGTDMSSIGCGFGFVVANNENAHSENDVVFYLDEICYHGNVVSNTTPRFIASYETSGRDGAKYIENAAFSYDNALCAMAFMSAGEQERAKLILDAFVYAIDNDRYSPGRVRNAYVYGDPESFPGWGGSVRLPGFFEDGTFCEDQYQVGTNMGNTSFVALALLQYYNRHGGEAYLRAARSIMDFALEYCQDENADGYFAGYDGWPENGSAYRFTYKSTEHNIDVYAACTALYQLTGEEKYKKAADSALRFIDSMYDETQGIFWSGTMDDGVTPNSDNVVLDVQVWSALALGDAFEPYKACVQYAADNLQTPGGGYAFSLCDTDGGYWLEGTAFSSLAFRKLCMDERAKAAIQAIETAQLDSGGLPAVYGSETINTGFGLFTGEKWLYYAEPHIAPVAWYILAMQNNNPYVLSSVLN